MTKLFEVYKCEVCGNMVEVIHKSGGELVCCEQPMKLMEANSVDASREKHVPVIEKTADGYRVTVGSIAHPMEEKHYIEWIEFIADDKVCRKFLNPGDKPEATFCISAKQVTAKAYCNLHGLWRAEL